MSGGQKLTAAKAADIRERLARGGETIVKIAREYGVSAKTVGDIKFGRSWVVREPGCNVTVYANTLWATARPCGLPLAPGAGFCVGHEADRVRLGGASS